MKVRREPISQLTRISRQIHIALLQRQDHLLLRALITAILAICQRRSLVIAAPHRPHQQVGDIARNGLGEGGELVGVVADGGAVAFGS